MPPSARRVVPLTLGLVFLAVRAARPGSVNGDVDVERKKKGVDLDVVDVDASLSAPQTSRLALGATDQQDGEHGSPVEVPGSLYSFHLQDEDGNVKIDRWNGRLGNNVLQMAAALSYAKFLGSKALVLPSTNHFPTEEGRQLPTIFQLPEKIELSEASDEALRAKCEGVEPHGLFWGDACGLVSAKLAHQLVLKYIQPHLGEELKACIAAPYNASEASLLTVHLRTGDVLDLTAPCSFVERVLKDEGLEHVLLVSAGEHPCEATLVDRLGRHRVEATRSFKRANSPLLADFCTLIRAKHLVLAHSSFPEAALLLGGATERTVHKAGTFEPWRSPHPAMFDYCVDDEQLVWEHVQLKHYSFEAYNGTQAYGEAYSPKRVRLMQEHNETKVVLDAASRCGSRKIEQVR